MYTMRDRLLRKGDYIFGSFLKPEVVDGYINGVNPGDRGDVLGRFPFSEQDVDDAIDSAAMGGRLWRRVNLTDRANALYRYREALLNLHESIAILITPLLVLGGTAVAVLADAGRAGMLNPGGQGFSEVLYAFSSAANNNGSAFAGLSANTPFYNLMLALAMALGRFGVIVPVLAIAGSLAAKPRLAASSGTMPTHGSLFVALLVGTVILIGALTYIPALALGPVIEHLQLFGVPR